MLTRAVNDQRVRARQGEHLVIAGPRRRWDEHLVALTEQHEAGVEQRLLAASGNDDLARRHVVLQAGACTFGDRLAQGEDAFDERVSRRARIERAFRAVANEGRRRKVGLARAEVDDRATGCAERLRARRNGDRRGFGEVDDVGRWCVVQGHRG